MGVPLSTKETNLSANKAKEKQIELVAFVLIKRFNKLFPTFDKSLLFISKSSSPKQSCLPGMTWKSLLMQLTTSFYVKLKLFFRRVTRPSK